MKALNNIEKKLNHNDETKDNNVGDEFTQQIFQD